MHKVETEHVPWSLLNVSSISNLNYLYIRISHRLRVVPEDVASERYLPFIALLPKSMERIDIGIWMAFRNSSTYLLPAPTGAIRELHSKKFPVLKTLKMHWTILVKPTQKR